ncbi:MAG: helix-turn-helix domain-containing protein [Ruminococcaceae bacterium]|nr:helix-turn-helix domain-containing protein [Oscillospiraceae bacterium]
MDKAASIKRDYRTDNFIRFLLDGKREITQEEVEIRKKNLDLSLLNGPFAVAMIAPDYSGIPFGEKDVFFGYYEKYIKEYLFKIDISAYTYMNSFNNIVVLLAYNGKEAVTDSINSIFIKLHEELIEKFSLEVFIGIGNIVDTYNGLAESTANAQEMLSFKYQYADRGVVNIATIVKFQYNISRGNGIEFERVIGCFKDGNLGKMEIRLNELVESVRHRPNVSGTSIRRTLVELAVHILHTASNAGVDVDSVLGNTDPYRFIIRQNHTEIITEWIMKISSKLLNLIHNRHQTEEKIVIQKAKSYIEENLSDINLGLMQVSNVVGLSNTYLSQLFKKETGVGITNYITEMRIERAKQLLAETSLSAAEISRQVGFVSAGYFGQVFKKNVEVTPQEYRRNTLKN